LSIGVDVVGIIKTTFPANFDYGPGKKSKYSSKYGKYIHKFSFEIQVVFGGKGSNLTFKTVVDGNVVSTADIEFNQR
jgi:hypothetical protein